MARRIANIATNSSLVAYGDAAALVNGTYLHCLQIAGATQLVNVWEVSINGQAASTSSPMFMLLSYDGTAGVGTQSYGTGSDVGLNGSAISTLSTPIGTGNVFVTSAPQRSAAGHLLNCSLNAFGGVYFWRANRVEECPVGYGTSTPYSGISVSAFTGSTIGAVGSHLIYESL